MQLRHRRRQERVASAGAGIGLTTALILLATASPARAEVVITNLPNNTTGGSSVSSTDLKSLIFSTGPASGRINAIQLGLNPYSAAPSLSPTPLPLNTTLELSIWSTTRNGSGPLPSAALATSPALPVTINAVRQIYRFTNLGTLSSLILAPNTTYGLTLSGPTGNLLRWSSNGDINTGTTPTGLNGYTFITFAKSCDAGQSWGQRNCAFGASTNTVLVDVTLFSAYAAFQSVGLNALRFQRELLLSQAGHCQDNGWLIHAGDSVRPSSPERRPKRPLCLFTTAGNANATLQPGDAGDGYDSRMTAGLIGLELSTDSHWLLGMAYGYGSAALNQQSISTSSINATINSASVYAVYRPDASWTIKSLLGYGNHSINGSRESLSIDQNNTITSNTIRATTSANGFTAAVLADYSLPLTKASSATPIQWKPMLGIAYGAYQQNGFNESGDPSQTMTFSPHTAQSLIGMVGAELEASLALNTTRSRRLKPRLAVIYQLDALANLEGNTSLETTVSGGQGPFLSHGQNRGSHDLTVSGSLQLEMSSQASLYASANYETYRNGSGFAYAGGFKISF